MPGQKERISVSSRRIYRHHHQSNSQIDLPYPPPLGQGPQLHRCRRGNGAGGRLLLPQRPHSKRHGHLRLHCPYGQAYLAPHRLYCIDLADRFFPYVPGRAHSLGRRSLAFDRCCFDLTCVSSPGASVPKGSLSLCCSLCHGTDLRCLCAVHGMLPIPCRHRC